VKDVLPHDHPIKNIYNFALYCKYFIFPFLQVTQVDKDDEGDMAQAAGDEAGQLLAVEIWGRAPGLFVTEFQRVFLKNTCSFGLHYIGSKTFRLSINSVEGDSMNAIFLELMFDDVSFNMHFQNVSVHSLDGVRLRDREYMIPSLQVVDSSFIDVIDDSLKEF
jgi:hypothetical protein